ncbi:MAG: response regulator [Acetobacteraceae bacterium]|nr:response regulator [Acetobacteraceae bacterium]
MFERERAAPAPRARPARRLLALFAAALALPILAFAGGLLGWYVTSERGRLEADARGVARSLAITIDRELSGITAALEVMAASPALRRGDLEAFYGMADSLRRAQDITTVLRDAEGQQLINTRRPFGAPLPGANVALPPLASLASGRVAVSGVFHGPLANEALFAVEVAVPAGDRTVLLSLSLPASRVRTLLENADLPAGWTAAVVDADGLILARNNRHDEFVRTRATPDLLANARGAEGQWRGTTADGAAVLGVYARPSLTPWRVAIGVPVDLLQAPLRRSLWLIAAAGVLLAALATLLSTAVARRLTTPLQTLEGQAARLGRGAAVVPQALGLREAARADAAMAEASRLLRQREEDLLRLNAALEGRVAERTRELQDANDRLRAEAAERNRAEAQLRQAQKMEAVGRLTGGVAHDFNNLLTAVIGNLEVARRRLGEEGDPRLARPLAGAAEGARRAAALIARLLAFSRQQPLAPQPVDANRLVAGMSDLLRHTLGEGVAVETVLAGGLWRCLADPNQLETAILNLAVNGRDAMEGRGRLTIETANAHLDAAYCARHAELRPGQYVLVCVSDTGTGMPPEILGQAFEPFFTTKPAGQGTGLGLSQVYGFAKQSGGHTAIYSEPGQGTTVRLYLPRTLQAEPARPLPGPDAEPRTEAATILLLEDDAMVRDFATTALEEAGHRVLAAADGAAALALLDRHPDIALLFTDVVLGPEMNGREVADAARARRPDLPVLFTTGYTRNAIIHHGRLDADVTLLSKPYTAAELAAAVARRLSPPSAPPAPADPLRPG